MRTRYRKKKKKHGLDLWTHWKMINKGRKLRFRRICCWWGLWQHCIVMCVFKQVFTIAQLKSTYIAKDLDVSWCFHWFCAQQSQVIMYSDDVMMVPAGKSAQSVCMSNRHPPETPLFRRWGRCRAWAIRCRSLSASVLTCGRNFAPVGRWMMVYPIIIPLP